MSVLVNYLSPKMLWWLPIIGLIIVGYLVERRYVSRPSLFANMIALNFGFYGFISGSSIIQSVAKWYVNISVIIGLVAILSYMNKHNSSLPNWFYTIGWFYSSWAIALVLVVFSLT